MATVAEHRSSSPKVGPQFRGFKSTSLPREEMCTPAWTFFPVCRQSGHWSKRLVGSPGRGNGTEGAELPLARQPAERSASARRSLATLHCAKPTWVVPMAYTVTVRV
jgi:hypothetical protein